VAGKYKPAGVNFKPAYGTGIQLDIPETGIIQTQQGTYKHFVHNAMGNHNQLPFFASHNGIF
jgi:hypothetical protein